MADQRGALGLRGEQVAAAYLERAGYRVLVRRWRYPGGEIDLVLRDATTLVFAEVRARRADAGLAAESVGPRKQQRLIRAAYSYLAAHDLGDRVEWRIDVVAVAFDARGGVRVVHIPGAVEG